MTARNAQGGFMIVGVVVFVLALTILGLSLFSLSSFEAQFMGTSIHETQAFNTAMGGLERLKNVLSARDSLGAAKFLQGSNNIVYARARYADDLPDSLSGDIDWSGTRDLELRVAAEVKGARCMVEERVTPSRSLGFYENLITTTTGVVVAATSNASGTSIDVGSNTFMDGHVWQNDPDETWNTVAQFQFERTVSHGGVPLPAANAYIQKWQGQALPTPATSMGVRQYSKYSMFSAADTFQHYIGPIDPGSGFAHYNGWDAGDPVIEVSGTVIWMLPGGAHFQQSLQVVGSSQARLIIVATKGTAVPFGGGEAGLWLRGGIQSFDVPVILISDGTVSLEQLQDYPNSWTVRYLSIFANRAAIKGPGEPGVTPQPHTYYRHLDGNPYLDEDVLDQLMDWGILPNASSGSSARYALVKGTWREITESTPN